ncbi:MAG TPA: amidohydrolase family protein [Bryobacteraceae bacterium]|nr:amidohydrolase family protein [Bryobacteraceae bacterium]
MVDSHQHFWDPAALRWDAPPAPIFRRAFLPPDLLPEIKAAGITHTVLVQGYPQTPATNRWLFSVANRAEHVRGVVAWVDLLDPRHVGKALDQLQREPKFVGIRHIVTDEPDGNWILRNSVLSSLGELARRGICFDMLVKPQQLRSVLKVMDKLPDLRMVVDHLGNHLAAARQLTDVGRFTGAYCKLSGIDWTRWSPSTVRPYVRQVIDAFGWNRVMFGSDWPVCLLTGNYQRVWQATHEALGDSTAEQRDRVFGKNALEFYTT